MTRRRHRVRFAARIAPLLLLACNGGLIDVPNLNNPDVFRAYATPGGIEAVIASTYRQVWGAETGCFFCINTQGHAFALELYTEGGAYATRSVIPRPQVDNSRGNSGAADSYALFLGLSKVPRTSANAIQALDRLIQASVTDNAMGSRAQDARARAFAYFTSGLALGGLALAFDSAAIVTPSLPSDAVAPLAGYGDVMQAALTMLDSAILVATSPAATNGLNGYPIPATWISGNPLTLEQFVRLVRSNKARFRAGVARSPAERTAVDWTAVAADAAAGITDDFIITLSVSAGWSGGALFDVSTGQGNGALPMLTYGMADTSGAFAGFIGTPIAERDGAFLVRTPDERFPKGATRAAQRADTPVPLPGRRYIRNRDSGDPTLTGYGFSFYSHARWAPIVLAGNNGAYTAINKAEMDMLVAEGLVRAGNFAAARSLIDASRARSGLPSIGAITSASQPIAGGGGCVPKVPQPPAFTTVACGTIFEAMKWEKRMETAFSCMYLCWYTDSRGWGDLPEGTAIHWPVPYQEMDARLQPFYSLGGSGPGGVPRGTYGY